MIHRLRCCVLLFVLSSWFAGNLVTAAGPPNIIVIVSDDQGWGDFSGNGNENLSTPNLDRLAQAGASFEHFFVQPVCSPTRAEFLTGRYAFRSNVFRTSAGGERMNLGVPTIADALSDAGYRTAAFGKWHNGAQYPYHPCGRGFDSFYGFASGHWGNYFDPVLERNGRLIQGNGFLANDLTDQTIKFVEEESDRPFFAYLALNTPHSPMQVPDRFYEKFKNAPIKQRGTVADREDLQHTRAALAMCENIDFNVGRLLANLEQRKLADDTIVIYFCDNGPNGHRFNGGMKGIKGSTDEGGVRSPLFVRWPAKINPGTVVSPIAGAIDLLPTLVEMTETNFDARLPLDGMSLVPWMVNPNTEIEDRLLLNHWNGRISVRSQRYRLDNRGKLFDMEQDPQQLKPIKDAQIQQKLTAAANAWKEEISAAQNQANRPFTVGYVDFPVTHLPADDAIVSGDLKRSNKFPNCSYFTNWTSVDDRLAWPIEVDSAGSYRATIYYACKAEDVGCKIQLSDGEHNLTFTVNEAHDPPQHGAEQDRLVRQESYVKDFKALSVGTIELNEGVGELHLKALEIPGKAAVEFRLLTLELLK